MLLSSYTVSSLTYVLPTELGFHVEYYFLELVPIVLNLTVCIVCTARIMDFFEKRNQTGAREEGEAGLDGVERRNQTGQDEAGGSLFFEIGKHLNTMVLVLMILGCEFDVPSLHMSGYGLLCHFTSVLL